MQETITISPGIPGGHRIPEWHVPGGKAVFRAVIVMCILLIPLMLQAQDPERERINRSDQFLRLHFGIPDTGSILRKIRTGRKLLSAQPDSAMVFFDQALQESKQAGYLSGMITALAEQGKAYDQLGQFEKSLSLNSLALALCSDSSTRKYLAAIHNNIGISYTYLEQYDQAARFYFRAAVMGERYTATMPIGAIYSNLASICMRLNQFDRAEQYLDKAEQLARQEKDYQQLGNLLLNKGVHYFKYKKDVAASERCFLAAIELYDKHQVPSIKMTALSNLGGIYLEQGNPRKALAYAMEARQLHGIVNPTYVGTNLNHLAHIYLMLKDDRAARLMTDTAIEFAETYKLVHVLSVAHEIRSHIFASLGQPEQALEEYKRYIRYRDSLKNEKVANDLNHMHTQYHVAEKNKQLIQSQLLIARQRNIINEQKILVGSVLAGILLLGTSTIAIYRIFRHRQKLQQQKIHNLHLQQENLKRLQEIDQLKAVMTGEEQERSRIARELHDGIGGMLAAINMHFNVAQKKHNRFAQMEDMNQIMRMLQDTSDEVRKTAHNLMPSILANHNLADALHQYCAQIIVDNGLHVDLHLAYTPEILEKSTELVIFRMIQELIQNILKHAGASHVVIDIEENGDQLMLTIEDNGVGFDITQQKNGFGLKNLHFRVHALHGTMKIESEINEGTTIHIIFDIKKIHTVSSAL